MNYEQKYKKAIERAKKEIKECGDNQYRINMIKRILPELRESEDEKIRKEIISFITDRKNWFPKEETKAAWIAWLEKQGEHNPNN